LKAANYKHSQQADAAQCLADALIKEEGGDYGALAAR
jgi:plasmid stability protein